MVLVLGCTAAVLVRIFEGRKQAAVDTGQTEVEHEAVLAHREQNPGPVVVDTLEETLAAQAAGFEEIAGDTCAVQARVDAVAMLAAVVGLHQKQTAVAMGAQSVGHQTVRLLLVLAAAVEATFEA